MSSSKITALAAIVVLSAIAALVNLRAPTVFFDSQIMLGGSLAVFALLQFGWPGLLVGLVALGATALRWGHPFELLIGTAFLVWLKIFLDRFNGGWSSRDNGRIVPAAAAFWLVAGLPAEVFLFSRSFDMPMAQALGIGLKESVTGLLNTTLGLLAFLVLRWWTSGRQPGTFSIRGLTFAAILAAISIPGLGLTLILSNQLKTAVLEQQFLDLRFYGDRAADLAELGTADALDTLAREGGDKQFLLRRADGSTISSDPALFERLQQNYEIETPSRTGSDNLGIFRPLEDAPVIETDADSYWFATFERPGDGAADAVTKITVVEKPPEMVRLLDYQLLLPSFSVLLGLLLGGTWLAAWGGRAAERQFQRVLPAASATSAGAPMQLARSRIRELDTLVVAVNELDLARQQSREELQRILENLPIAVASSSLGNPQRNLYFNRQFTETFGYTVEETPTKEEWAVRAYPDPAYRREVFAEWDAAVARAVEEKGTVESMEFEVAAKDGQRRNVVFHAVVMEDRLLITLTDLTARRQAETELQSVREKLQCAAYELTENIPIGTYAMVQPPGGGLAYFSFMSTRFLELTGLTAEKARENPMNAFACVHPDDYDAWVRKNVYAFENKRPFYETCRIVADGVTRWITAESTPRNLPDGSVVWEGVLTDVTARKKAEDELVAARRREKEIEQEMRETLQRKLKTSLNAAAVAHEINQPLSRILLRAQLELERSSGREREALQLLIEDAKSVVTIIDKMRVLLRNVETPHQTIDLSALVNSALLQVKSLLRREHVEIATQLPDDPIEIRADDVQLQIALTNLLTNAVQAIAAHGGPRREIRAELVLHRDTVELIIGDSGPGWPGGTIDEMLLRTSKPGGTGIGLYIVKTTIDHHQGQITVGRSPLGGAEFRLTFPRCTPGNLHRHELPL